MADTADNEFAGGTVPAGQGIPVLGPLGTGNGAPLGGLQSILSNGIVGTGPPTTVGVLSPEPVPRQATDDEILEAITTSNEVMVRNLARLPQYHPDQFLRGKNLDILDELKTYAAYNSPERLKKYAILYKAWDTLPRVNGQVVKDDHPRYDRACEIAEFCRYALDNIMDPDSNTRLPFREVAWYFLDAMHIGNSMQEVVWRIETKGQYKGKRIFSKFISRHPKQITYNLNPLTNEVVSINNYTALGWQSYLPLYRKFFRYTYQPERGLPWGRGDARAAYKHVVSLNELMRMWGVALQKHGGGFLKGTTQNPDEAHIKEFQTQLDLAQSTSSIVVTGDKSVEIMNLPGGALDAFCHPIKYHEESIAREILGQSLTTGNGDGQGSYALGTVHEGTEEYYRAFPRRDLEEAVRDQLYFWLIKTNFGDEDLDCLPEHSQGVWNWEEQTMIAKFIEIFTNMGYMRPDYDDDWARKKVGLPFLPTTKELDTQNPAILPDKERVMIQVGGNTYQGTKMNPVDAVKAA